MSLEKHPVCRGDLHGVFSCHEGRGLPCLPPDRPVTAGSAQPCSPGLLPARGAGGEAGHLCWPPSSTSRPSTHTSSSPHSLPPTVKHTVFEPASPVPLQNTHSSSLLSPPLFSKENPAASGFSPRPSPSHRARALPPPPRNPISPGRQWVSSLVSGLCPPCSPLQ